MENTKFKLSADCIEISGSEKFVEEQLESFKPLIMSSYDRILNNKAIHNSLEQNVNNHKLPSSTAEISHSNSDEVEFIEVKDNSPINHESVYVLDGDKFQMISDVPGDSIRAQMVAVILIYMYAKLNTNIETVTFTELRDICANYGVLDGKNFAAVMDNNRKYFLLLGSGKSRSAKLVRPGIKEAERLIKEINNKSKL